MKKVTVPLYLRSDGKYVPVLLSYLGTPEEILAYLAAETPQGLYLRDDGTWAEPSNNYFPGGWA